MEIKAIIKLIETIRHKKDSQTSMTHYFDCLFVPNWFVKTSDFASMASLQVVSFLFYLLHKLTFT